VGALAIGYSVKTPAVVIRPIFATLLSGNQSAPSEPTTMPPNGLLPAVGIVNSEKDPPVVIRPI
jgi:hypothetical protein